MESQDNKITCLHDRHVALKAQMSPFAGFDMPIQYSGIVEEHCAVRSACGVFDVSHMGEVYVRGVDAEKYVNHLFTNDVSVMTDGKIQYGMMCNHQGGVVDDLLVYKCNAEEYLLVINAANIDKDVAWIKANAAGYSVEIDNVSDMYGQIAVQGPRAEAVLSSMFGLDLSEMAFYTFTTCDIDSCRAIVSRTGYTGEDGFEIYACPEQIVRMWDRLVASGHCMPCGLGCRDTLRFEVGLPLYGDELADDISPLEAGLGMFVKLDKPDGFIGSESLKAQKEAGLSRKLVGIELADKAIPRHGYDVLEMDGDEVIGHVTTGYHAISVDKSVALALVDARYAKLDTPLRVRIRRKTFPCRVVKRRFYDKHYKK